MQSILSFKFSATFFLSALFILTCGCSRQASFDSLTANTAKKEALLGGQIEKFKKDITWGSISRASRFVEGSSRMAFGQIYSRRVEKEKILKMKIQSVDFKNESDEADVILETQFFKKPSLYIDKRYEKQLWAYNRLEGGWLLRNSKVIDENQVKKMTEITKDSF